MPIVDMLYPPIDPTVDPYLKYGPVFWGYAPPHSASLSAREEARAQDERYVFWGIHS